MAPAGMISIGALAKRSGVQAETIRYYETEGLLPKPERSAGGYRLYGASDVDRLSFIRQARELGFKLDSVRRLLSLADREVNTCDVVRELASAHLAEIRTKIADLRRMERVLTDLVKSCEGRTTPECLLLEALAAPDVSRAAMPKARSARQRIGSRRSRSRRRGGEGAHGKAFLIYAGAAVAEIAGCFAFWVWLRSGKSALSVLPGIVSLIVFAWLLTLIDSDYAGRAYAAYGGIYVAAAVGWLWLLEGARPDRWDVVGAAVVLMGAAIILFGPRST